MPTQEISDDLSEALAEYMAQSSPSASITAQQKSYLTYTVPTISLGAPRLTLLEAPSLLSSSGTTGFRTWEAALFLGTYLSSFDGSRFVVNRNIIELGAGTGFLAILCAKHLDARHVLATDGSREIITDMQANLDLNAVNDKGLIQTSVLQWGHTLINGVADCRRTGMIYDLAIGADVIYDVKSIPSLVATMHDLFELYPSIQVIVSATVRKRETLDLFITACSQNRFIYQKIDVPMTEAEKQIGFFVPTTTPIEILLIKKQGPAEDPFCS